MNYLVKLAKHTKHKQRKQKKSSVNNFIVFTVVGVAIGGVYAGLFARRCLDEITNIVINNAKDIDGEIDIDDEIDIKRDEIKQTLKKVPDESVGDVGAAMEKAFDEMDQEKQNDELVAK